MRIPPICEPASRRQTQFISPPKFHSHLLEWNGFQRWPHRAPQPARGCFPIRQHRAPQQGGGGAGRRAGRRPSQASEPTLNFKRLIRKRRPFPSLRAAKREGAGISRGLCGGGNEVTVTAPVRGGRGRRSAYPRGYKGPRMQPHLFPRDPCPPSFPIGDLCRRAPRLPSPSSSVLRTHTSGHLPIASGI